MRGTVIAALMGFLMLASGCAHQEDVLILDRRLSRVESFSKSLDKRTDTLESQIDGLSHKYAENGAEFEAGKESFMSALDRYDSQRRQEDQRIRQDYAAVKATIDALRDELQRLQGRLEETEYRITQQMDAVAGTAEQERQETAQLAKDIRRIDERLQQIEQYLNLEGIGEPSGTAEPQDTQAETLTDKTLYVSAKQAFDNGQFDNARSEFEKLIRQFPDSPHADNAQFWIGEIYYREKWYEKAILEYQKVIEKYPQGNKVPAALLKQGFAFISLDDNANARLILEELTKRYPQTNEGNIATQKLQELQ